MKRLLAIAGICTSLVLAACGESESESAADGEPAAPSAESQAPADAAQAGDAPAEKPERPSGSGGAPAKPGVKITTGESQFGTILFDGDQRAIYLFDKESSKRSECYGDCAAAWPPVLTKGDPEAKGGLDAGLLGTTERDDGSTQVTFGGHPLYYYVDDPPGQVLCHNVEEFGGLWLVLEPGGGPVL